MTIGIIREGKVPPDSRVPLTPDQCKTVTDNPSVSVIVQPSEGRCFPDQAYLEAEVPLREDMQSCDILMGVKEVPIGQLIPGKTYFFFSHTIKEQAYNRDLLRAILDKKIRLIDYEVLTNDNGQRLIAFGHFAGMVGAHNALWTYGKRSGAFSLGRMKDFHDYAAAKHSYQQLELPAIKIVLTGTGRVAGGAQQVLTDMSIRQVSPEDFLHEEFNSAVFTQLSCGDYVRRKDGENFDTQEFYDHPEKFESSFEPFTKVSDVMINGIYWDNNAPAFFTQEQMKKDDFKIEVIGDVTCDIAPVSSIPSTLEASTIDEPVFGYDPANGEKTGAFQSGKIDMMTIDNLPNELPRDASRSFGEQFIEHILPELLKPERSEVLERATVAENGALGKHFQYLNDYVNNQ